MRAPGDRTLDHLFAGRPAAFELFRMARAFIESLGPIVVDVMKTQVSFGAKTKFAWVWLPQQFTTKRPDQSITLTFDLDHRVEDERIAEAVEPKPGRWTHHVVIEDPGDLDDHVKAWLAEAYALGAVDRRKRRDSVG